MNIKTSQFAINCMSIIMSIIGTKQSADHVKLTLKFLTPVLLFLASWANENVKNSCTFFRSYTFQDH